MGKIKKYISLIPIIAVHLILLSRLRFAPYPELFIYPYLRNIGLVPYLQIFDQHFPGLMFLPVNLATLGFTDPSSMRLLYFLIVGLTQILIFTYVYKITHKVRAGLFASIVYMIWQPYLEGNVLWIDNFIPLLLLPSAYHFHLYMRNRRRQDIVIAGFSIGLALLFKQVVLPLILLLGLILLVKRGLRDAASFTIPALVPLMFLFLYILRIGIWKDFYFWTVEFNLGTFADMGRKYATVGQLVRVMAIFAPSVLALRKKESWVPFTYLLGAIIFAYARFDFVHLQPALPFVAIMIALFIDGFGGSAKRQIVVAYLCLASLLISPYLRASTGQDVLFFSKNEEQLTEIISQKTSPGDSIFIFGAIPHLYALTSTHPAGNLFVFQFPWFMVEAQERILDGIKSDPPLVVLRDETASTGGMRLLDYMPDISNYIDENYKTDTKIGTIDILVPR